MKKERKKMLLHQMRLMVCFAFLTSSVFAQSVSTASPKRVKAEDFIIFPWGHVPTGVSYMSAFWGDLVDADGVMKDLFDCGYNTTGFIAAKDVRYAVPYNLAVILYDERVAPSPDVTPKEAEATVRSVLNEVEPAELRKTVYSIYLRDEPNASLFPQLNVWADAIKKQGILPYINLLPSPASNEQLGSNGYEDHLNSFVSICKPSYLSYDNYSLFGDQELNENGFYGNLELVRKKTLQSKIPFWNVILSNAHYNYSEPSAATFNIQVYSTLAYGGKGIGYFTHYTPTIGNYRLAPIDQFGYRTKTWALMQNVNMQIHALAPVYCKLKSVNVFHTGKVPSNAQGKETAVHLQSINDEAFLVGEFVDPAGKPYLFVVNKDTKKSVRVDVAFKKEGKIKLVSPFGHGMVSFEGEEKWLAPGAGILLTIE